MSTQVSKTFPCLLGLLALASAGCNRGPSFAEVSGTVRVNGKPLDKAMVEFVPDTAKGAAGPSSVAYTDERGQYTLTSYTNVPGAVVGSHRVLIHDLINYPATQAAARAGQMGNKPLRVSTRYADMSQTPLHKEVKAGGPQTIDLDVPGAP